MRSPSTRPPTACSAGLKVVLDGRGLADRSGGASTNLKALLKPGGKGEIVCSEHALEDRSREVEIAMPGRFDISPAQAGILSTTPGVREVLDI